MSVDEDPWHDLLFGVRRSVRYHMHRQRFFERWHTVTSAISVIFGSATVALVLSQIGPEWVAGSAIVVTFFSAIDLVVGTSKSARSHNDLARRFIDLEKAMVGTANPEDDDQRRFVAQRLTIEADEPPVLRNLDVICHNELLRSMGYADGHAAKLGPIQRALAQFCDWRHHAVKTGGTTHQG